ncbi:MAG: radical SAM family heme chaperone HemW [Rhodobacteraceae bacterium]|nr:radical SAM family heme chaperone HemW [Paracoccaceae bacterium]
MAPRFGLYIHWPFCAAKCPYCDFNSHVTKNVDVDRWDAALRHELKRVAEETPDHVLSTIFFGGGTPSLMAPSIVEHLIEDAFGLWRQGNEVEVTLEANPTSVETDRLREFRAAGVNRVSMGVQALNDRDLRKLGRMHSTVEAMQALDIARNTFDRVSIDLIYARQDQTPSAWEAELSEALGLGLDHLSLYQLTIEQGTDFGKRHAAGKLRGLPGEDMSIEMWDMTQELTTSAGMPAYEISNHARSGAESRHNQIYWTGGDWGGIGPGAHGRLTVAGTRLATETELIPGAWLNAVEKLQSGETVREALSLDEVFEERVIMGLRLRDGVDLHGMECRPDPETVAELSDMGLLTVEGDVLKATETGRPLLNSVISKLLT